MAQTNNALPPLKPKEDKHHIFNDGKERTIRYVEWKDEMKTKARSCAKNHGIKVLMGDMTSSSGKIHANARVKVTRDGRQQNYNSCLAQPNVYRYTVPT